MAKRRKLEAPTSDDLTRLEEEFRRETSGRPAMGPGRAVAPIAQVAGDSAALAPTASPEVRAEHARHKADAERLHQAEQAGLLMADVPIAQIEADAMVRDRTDLAEDEMMELRLSIAASGLRLPIEVFELAEPRADGKRYGLLSGYRRLMAVHGLLGLSQDDKYRSIRAIIRPRAGADAAFAAMVEENEVRAELSQFERGRIAVIAAQQGAFVNVEEAVNRLFASASKAKRSKVRSFALIFEELGDMLAYPEALSEKRGLRLAQALRAGAETGLRAALAGFSPDDPEQEWGVIEPVIAVLDAEPRDPRKGGRPSTRKPALGWQNAETLETSAGITIRRQRDSKGFVLRFEGRGLDSELMDSLMVEIQALLERGS
jgi:ParB family chromosome partitioning protein